MTPQELKNKAREDIESFDSFFSGLSADQENDAIVRYERYIFNKLTSFIDTAYEAGREDTAREIIEMLGGGRESKDCIFRNRKD